jgi:hypothetical protein
VAPADSISVINYPLYTSLYHPTSQPYRLHNRSSKRKRLHKPIYQRHHHHYHSCLNSILASNHHHPCHHPNSHCCLLRCCHQHCCYRRHHRNNLHHLDRHRHPTNLHFPNCSNCPRFLD